MATNITTNFVGDVTFPMVVEALTQSRTIEDGHCFIEDGINKDRFIARLKKSGTFIQAYTATPSTSGDFNYTERVIDPVKQMVYSEFLPMDWRNLWPEYAPAPGQDMMETQVPNEGLQKMQQLLITDTGFKTAQGLWNGVAGAGTFKGWVNHAIDDGGIDATGGDTGAISAANVITRLDKVFKAIPAALKGSPDFKLFISRATHDFYMEALTVATYKGLFYNDQAYDAPMFKGKKVVTLDEFPDDVIFGAYANATPSSNLRAGVTNVANTKAIKIERKNAYQDVWFLKMTWAIGAQIAFPEETVYHAV